jgi:hypothetical protein
MCEEEKTEEIELELEIDVIVWLALEAHKRDMKMNDLICEILRNVSEDFIKRVKGNEEGKTEEDC